MVTESNDTKGAWEAFKEQRSFEKATSIQGQLDTLTALLQDIQTDTKRTAGIVDQIQGDNAAIDYENANAEAMPPAPMGDPDATQLPAEPTPEEAELEGEPAGDMLGAGGDVLPEDGEEVDEGGPANEDINALMGGETPEDLPVPGAEDMSAPAPEMAEPAVGGGNMMVDKIKNLISTTSDPDTLRGLTDLLNAALDQGAAPPVPMESDELAPIDPGMMKAEPEGKTEDINDGLRIIEEEIAEAVNSDLGEDFGEGKTKHLPDSVEGCGGEQTDAAEKKDFHKAEPEDPVKAAENAVNPTNEEAPEPLTTVKAEDAPEDVGIEEDDDKKDEPKEEGKAEPEPEVVMEISEEVAPESEPADPVVAEITEKVTEAVEGIVDSVLNGDETQSFKQAEPERFADMMKAVWEGGIGIDGMPYKQKEKPMAKGKVTDRIVMPGYDEMDGGGEDIKKLLTADGKGEGMPLDEKGIPVYKNEDETESSEKCDGGEQVHAPLQKSASDTGVHIQSIADMMSGGEGGFSKSVSMGANPNRPDISLTYGHNPNRPTLDVLTGSGQNMSIRDLMNSED